MELTSKPHATQQQREPAETANRDSQQGQPAETASRDSQLKKKFQLKTKFQQFAFYLPNPHFLKLAKTLILSFPRFPKCSPVRE